MVQNREKPEEKQDVARYSLFFIFEEHPKSQKATRSMTRYNAVLAP